MHTIQNIYIMYEYNALWHNTIIVWAIYTKSTNDMY